MGRWGDGEMGRWGDGEMGECGKCGKIFSANGVSNDGIASSQKCVRVA
ncbi:hypothetical protein [Moorena sp. SIO4G3]|nr:hypothetical protein [Moorena sp. SIO4G3]NEO77459.1 hypothetical protein [Moorena sp. SIO4G3]